MITVYVDAPSPSGTAQKGGLLSPSLRALHDSPSLASAEQLVQWLGQEPANVRALDLALVQWALGGAARVNAE
jgi:hypothetical protein